MMKPTTAFLAVSVLIVNVVSSSRAQHRVPALVIASSESVPAAGCPGSTEGPEVLHQIVGSIISETYIPQCGEGLWNRVAYLNMSDPSQHCPSNWSEFTSLGVRACRRQPSPGVGSCCGVFFSIYKQFRKVCGRVIGYQFGNTDGFTNPLGEDRTGIGINGYYLDGVSITHGVPRRHIWSLASGVREIGPSLYKCPCSNDGPEQVVPPFVGENYFCESGNPHPPALSGIHADDKLWDGKQCSNEGPCCNNTTLPWFVRELPGPTTDGIEVRICGDEGTDNEGTPVVLMEIYVQ